MKAQESEDVGEINKVDDNPRSLEMLFILHIFIQTLLKLLSPTSEQSDFYDIHVCLAIKCNRVMKHRRILWPQWPQFNKSYIKLTAPNKYSIEMFNM